MRVVIPASHWHIAAGKTGRAAHLIAPDGVALCRRAGVVAEWLPAAGEGKCRNCIEAHASRYGSAEWREIIELEVVCE